PVGETRDGLPGGGAELQEAGGEKFHPALSSVCGQPAAGYFGGGVQKHVCKIREHWRGVHQQRARLWVHSSGT
uniref:Uncharacterized protein n=1 Tax=Oryzias melastigma TaxID=30732 RepID=A0A3B3D182_ORYME